MGMKRQNVSELPVLTFNDARFPVEYISIQVVDGNALWFIYSFCRNVMFLSLFCFELEQEQHNNRHIVYSPGPSQWAFDGDCRWLWLDSLFCLCPLVQDHTYDVGVPPDPLPPIPRLLLLQRANVCAAGSAHLLGRAHLAHGHQIPARQRMNCRF